MAEDAPTGGGGGGGGGRGGPASVWSRRFLALIDDLGMATQLRDGRRLARTGAVLGLRRTGNLVVAQVRHPDEEIHKARLAVRTMPAGDWARVERALATRAGYAAELLAGTVPPEIDRVFAALGMSPLPGADDIAMDCSCTDWARPCAHLAAACHDLARHVDHDPFEVLALRGRERDVLLDGLRTYRPIPVPLPGEGLDPGSGAPGSPADIAAGLPRHIEAFWSFPVDLAAVAGAASFEVATTTEDPADPEDPEDPGSVEDSADRESVEGAQSARAGSGPGSTRSVDPGGTAGDVLDRCGPLDVAGVGDLRVLLRPAYAAFTSLQHPGRETAGQ